MAVVLVLAIAAQPPAFCFAVFLAAFPVLCKLHLGHVQDSMVVCLPIPPGEVVGLNVYMCPLFGGLLLKGLTDIFSSRWQNPDAAFSINRRDTPFRAVDVWLMFRLRDLYSDFAALLTMIGSVNLGFQICWALTCIPSAALVVAVAACPVSEEMMWACSAVS